MLADRLSRCIESDRRKKRPRDVDILSGGSCSGCCCWSPWCPSAPPVVSFRSFPVTARRYDVIKTSSSRVTATSLGRQRQRQQPCCRRRSAPLLPPLVLPPPGPSPSPSPSTSPSAPLLRRRPKSLAGCGATWWLAVVLLVAGQLPPPVHTRAVAAEMLAVGPPLTTTTPTAAAAAASSVVTTSATSTLPPLLLLPTEHLPPLNYSLDVPQGDQPGPPFNEGTPLLPKFWKKSTNRTQYISNRYGKYLEMLPNGHTKGVTEVNSFCIFVLLSHYSNLVMKGYVSDKFLCMNSTTSQLYTRTRVHEDCYIQEAIRNGSGNIVYNYAHCRTPENKKCYLGMYRNGTMRLGSMARQSQNTAQWLAKEVGEEDLKKAWDEKEKIKKQGGWVPTTVPAVPTPKPVSRKEQRRKRVRRWCRNLSVIVKKPHKFVSRCKHDCDVLKRMIRYPKRNMRHCLISFVRRRIRNRARKRSGSGLLPQQRQQQQPVLDNEKIRARVQQLWPRRNEIFQRLRQLRRCNKRRRQRGHKRHSCSKREIRRQQRRRAKKRGQSKATPSASTSTSSSSTPRSRSRPSSSSSSSRSPRIRHQRKKTSRMKRRVDQSARSAGEGQEVQSKSALLLTALTSR